MQEHTAAFRNRDGQRIHTISWLPDSDPKAVVVLVHGIAEHSGRYRHVADYLTTHGYAIAALDHRGHGQSEGLRAYFNTFDEPVTDLTSYVEQVKAENPGKKVFMYGHSMGALISLLYILRNQSELTGWISSGIPLHLDQAAAAWIVVSGLVAARFVPKLPVFPVNSSTISHDPQVVQSYDHDPLNYRRPTRVGMAAGIVNSSRQARDEVHRLTLPVLIMHGGADPICPSGGSQYLYDCISSSDKTLKLYEGMYHEIHNEIDRDTVLNDVRAWLDVH